MDPVAPGFIAAGSHDPTAAHAPDDEGFALEAAVPQAFYGDKEGIKVQMEDCPVVHRPNIRQIIDYITVNNLTYICCETVRK
jgi:hypothetical protein